MQIHTTSEAIERIAFLADNCNEMIDNRFAVINGLHYELIDWSTTNSDDIHSIISVYKATDVCNMSNITNGHEYCNNESLIVAYEFTNERAHAQSFFLQQLKDTMSIF